MEVKEKQAIIDLYVWALDGEPLTTPEEREANGGHWRECRQCGAAFEQAKGARKRAFFCSKACQRYHYNHRYLCRDCGAPCRRSRCLRCTNRRTASARKKWTRNRCLDVLCEWIAANGKLPTYAEWVADGMNPRGNIIQREFGSWSAGVAAARARTVGEPVPSYRHGYSVA